MRISALPLLLFGLLPAVPDPIPPPRPAGPVSPAVVAATAAADAATLLPEIARRTRYLDARTLARGDDAAADFAVLALHVNSLSREVEIVPPRKVTPWLWAVCIDDYRWDSTVFGALREANSYYSIPVLTTDENGKQVADHVPNTAIPGLAQLVAATGSQTPLVRADQFFYLTAAQVDRAGFGYYDFLGLKSRVDAEKLATLDRKKAEDAFREHAAIIPQSGVGTNNRQIFRYRTVAGAWWETRDAARNDRAANAVANLDRQFKHAAEEIVFTLPNGLPGYYLSDAAGKQVDAVPDTIAFDHKAPGNDKRIHPSYSCVGCHVDGGLIPFSDYARRVYNKDTGIRLATLAVDPAVAKRLQSVYLGPLQAGYKEDQGKFAEAILDASGIKPADLSAGYRRVWHDYIDRPVTPAAAAFELGLTVEDMRDRFRTYARTKGLLDPVLAGLVVDDGPPVRREYWEERFPVAWLVVQGAAP